MNKYVVNHVIAGYREMSITDTRLVEGDNDIIVLVLNQSTSDKLTEYYNAVKNILISHNRLITIIVGKESNIRKPIEHLMIAYNNYNLYKVSSANIIDRDYADSLIEREPTIAEVQQFIGGDISAYTDISIVLSGINELANSGDLDGIKTLIEQHRESIECSHEVLDYMKRIVDESNSEELYKTISSLRNKLDESDKSNESNQREIRELRAVAEHLKDELTESKRDLAKANSKIDSLESQSSNTTSIVETYSELNTQALKTTCDHIIYFKEISYVRYMNSFVIALHQILKTKFKIKLLIYDNKVGLPSLYRPLSVIDSRDYMQNKSNFIQNSDKLVVVEPNPVIMENMITSISPKFDIIIVYDRMRQPKDIVAGNNVTKFFVINSNKDYESGLKFAGIRASDTIISGLGSSIPGALDIKTIPGYLTSTDTAKLAKYKKNMTSGGINLMATVLDKSHIKFGNE